MTQREKIPAELFDMYGYPTQEYLDFIKQFIPDESLSTYQFVNEVLRYGWYYAEWGFVLRKKYKGVQKLELHTGGWSGNEEIIRAIESNLFLTSHELQYYMWTNGGHHYFKLKNK